MNADALTHAAAAGGTQVTVERGADDVTFIVLGDLVTPTDFLFSSKLKEYIGRPGQLGSFF